MLNIICFVIIYSMLLILSIYVGIIERKFDDRLDRIEKLIKETLTKKND